MDRLSSIVVAVDFTPCSAAALTQAVRISQWNRAKLHIVHVIETLVVMELQEAMTPYVTEIQDSLIAEARQAWESFAPNIPGKAAMDFEIAINNPLMEIIKRVRDRNADLLIMGSHGVSPDRGTGILATQCVRRVPTKVLLVRDRNTGPFKNIAACVDFSEASRDALDAAFRVAAQDNAALQILHVFQPPWRRLRGAAGPAGGTDFARKYRESLMEELTGFCAPSRPEAAWAKPAFHLVEASSHGAGITEFVKASACDLAVLGTRGKTNLRDVIMGSTAERVVRDAPCAILAVKPSRS